MRGWVLLCLVGCGRIDFDPLGGGGGMVVGATAQLDVGGGYACVRTTAGELYCWGDNANGQLGTGGTRDASAPIVAAMGFTWSDIALGQHHSCALDMQGFAWCWGDNSNGQLGLAGLTCGDGALDSVEECDDMNTVNGDGCSAICGLVDPAPIVTTPTQLPGARKYRRIFAGGRQTFAIATDGTLWAWGRGGAGELGLNANGATGDRGKPKQVKVLAPQTGPDDQWSNVGAGDDHTCAIQNDKSLWCWGANASGELGQGGSTMIMRNIPEVVLPGTAWRDVANGLDYEVLVDDFGELYGCGRNDAKQLGLADGTPRNSPTMVEPGTYSTVSAGQSHACGLRSDQTLWCWGHNVDGETGTGVAFPEVQTPAQVAGLWSAVGAGTDFTCALDTAGAAWCFGAGTNGRLGDGLELGSRTPVQATTP